MFSREESKKIRQEFWTAFGKQSPKKWMLYNTKIKEINLKFDFDTKCAMVGIDCVSEDELIQAYYFEKIQSLKNILQAELNDELIFDEDYYDELGKRISKCYLLLEHVSIHNQKTWPEVFEFFTKNMLILETFFMEYKEYIEG